MIDSRYVHHRRRSYRGDVTTWQRPEPPARWLRMAQSAFVGRRSQFEILEQVWHSVRGGSRQLVFVGAEPGGGKTRFVAEAALALHGQGAGVLWGSCTDDMGMAHDPFVEPLVTLLGGLTAEGPGPELPRRTTTLLQTLSASTLDSEPGGADAGVMLSEARRAVVAALGWAAAVRPVVLVLEDVHWAGPAGLDLLKHVAGRLDDLPVLVLATLRNTPPDRSEELSRVSSDLFRLEGVVRLDLPGLDVDEIAAYLEQRRLGSGGEARRTAAILRDSTGGNPFLVRELCRELAGGASLHELTTVAPSTYAESVGSRLHTLGAEDRAVVSVAAVMGEELEVGELADAVARFRGVAVGRESVMTAVGRAKALGLLDPHQTEAATTRFPHALARRAVIGTLSDLDVARAHAAVALALESGHPAAARRTVRLAAHFTGAAVLGHEAAAVRYLTEAGDLAGSSSAHAEAADCYERAAGFTSDPHARDELLLAAARSSLLGWDGERARRLDEQVATSDDPALRLEAAIGTRPPTGATASTPEGPGTSWRARWRGTRRRPSRSSCSPPRTSPACTPGPATTPPDAGWAPRPSHGRGRSVTRCARQGAVYRPQRRQRVRPAPRDPRPGRGAERPGAGVTLAGGGVRARTAAPPAIRGRTSRRARARRAGAPGGGGGHRPAILGLGLRSSVLQPRPEQGGARARGRVPRPLPASGRADALVARRRRPRRDDAVRAAPQDRPAGGGAFPAAAPGREQRLGPGGSRPRDRAARDRADPRLAAPPAGHRSRGSPGIGDLAGHPDVPGRCGGVAARRRGGGPDAAAGGPYAGHNLLAAEFLHPLGSADLPRARLLYVLGCAGAEEAFESALAIDRRMGAILHEASTLAAYARHVTLHPVDGTDAAALAGQARVLADRHGLVRVQRDLDELAGQDRPRWGLTHREQEVLNLLGDGRSNREIAEILVISEYTAANHVRSILMKTRSANRTQAAVLARGSGQPSTPTIRRWEEPGDRAG